ncbi:MAG: SUMF1/EgtB/PvdO family nonheme iron enzyme [Candidatus Competibacteraceae bacterium]|nr:SUMF1/EgtB/PvdO family nonheme iron enzyme [Candidatus Competibacteraceae bacterium]
MRYYVEPKCQHYDPVDHHEDKAPASQVQAPIFTLINDFLSKEIALRDGRTQLFILADAGMGKTSLLVMLKLMHLVKYWPENYDCLLLKLSPSTLETVRQHPNKANTVLLLDALDADATAWGRTEQRLIELLHETTPFLRVFLSCRTRFFPETGADSFVSPGRVTVGGFICPMLFLSLFDDRQVHTYLSKRFPNPWHHGLTERRHPSWLHAEQLLTSMPMRSLRFRPLLLAHIQDLLDANPLRWDEYALHAALTETWLLREARKLAKQGIKLTQEDLWTSCTIAAVHLQTLGRRMLSQAELWNLVADSPMIAHIEQLDFRGCSLMNRTSDYEYQFSHYSTQEFLVVHALVEGQLEAVKKICPAATRKLKLRATAQMLDFLRCRSDQVNGLQLLKWLDWSAIKPHQWTGWLGFQERLRGGDTGPEMVVIPAGKFLMGSSPENEWARQVSEGPQRLVAFAQPFAMGRYAVTFEEYDRFCTATGRGKPSNNGWGRGRRPAINVSWEDAVAYCAWLSHETRAPYRLPSEAEWEYAARAGTTTAFWWGNEIDPTRANYDSRFVHQNSARGTYRQKTVPVDDFQPNPFGLYQVHGNVWEWVQDSWHDHYQGAPTDGSAWEKSSVGGLRVLRGGSWFNAPKWLRSATRGRFNPRFRGDIRGFRLARTLTF